MCSRTSCIETVVQVAGGVEAINSVFDTLGYELAARDGCRPGDVEHRSKAILGGVFAPVGEHVDVVGNVGDESETAFAQGAATFGECRRFLRKGLNISVLGQVRNRHCPANDLTCRCIEILQNLGLTGHVNARIDQSLTQSFEPVAARTSSGPRGRGLG